MAQEGPNVMPQVENQEPAQLLVGNVMGALDLVPVFSGNESSIPVADFLEYVDSAGSIAAWSDEQRLGVARIKLLGKAKAYVKSHPEVKALASWEEFKSAMLDKFQPKQPGVFADFLFRTSVQSPDENVDDFATRLRERGEATQVKPSNATEKVYAKRSLDTALLNYFINGLRNSLKPFVLTHDPTSFEEAVKIAIREEKNADLLARSRKGVFSVTDPTPAPRSQTWHRNPQPPRATPHMCPQHQVPNTPQFSLCDQIQPQYYPAPYPQQVYQQMPIYPQAYPNLMNQGFQPPFIMNRQHAPRNFQNFQAPQSYASVVSRGRGNGGGPVQGRNQGQPMECSNCGGFGHLREICIRPFRPICKGCGRRGHGQNECRATARQNPNGQTSMTAPKVMENRR
jgi:hypothetical protein